MGDNLNVLDPLEFLLQTDQSGIQLDFVDLQPVNLIEYITRAQNELQNIVNTGGLLFRNACFMHPNQTIHTIFMIRQKIFRSHTNTARPSKDFRYTNTVRDEI